MTPTTSFFGDYFEAIATAVRSANPDELHAIVRRIEEIHREGKKLILAGNGGSAAIASHVAVDFVKAAGIRAVNFNEADLITCFANDYGYERWVEEALEAYADEGDLVFLISSGGRSKNIVNAANKAKSMNLGLVTLSGFSPDNPLRKIGDVNLWIDSESYNVVEMAHHVWLVALVDCLVQKRTASRQPRDFPLPTPT